MGHQIEFNDYSSEIIEFKKEKQNLKHLFSLLTPFEEVKGNILYNIFSLILCICR